MPAAAQQMKIRPWKCLISSTPRWLHAEVWIKSLVSDDWRDWRTNQPSRATARLSYTAASLTIGLPDSGTAIVHSLKSSRVQSSGVQENRIFKKKNFFATSGRHNTGRYSDPPTPPPIPLRKKGDEKREEKRRERKRDFETSFKLMAITIFFFF